MGDKDQGKDLDQCVGMFFYLDKNTKEVVGSFSSF